MGTDDLFHKHKTKKNRGRTVGTMPIRPRILIVCEGQETEPNYFKFFRKSSVEIIGTGKNTLSLVKYAIEKRDTAAKKGKAFDEVWCVFDKDDFTCAQFNQAIQFASTHRIQVAYSNECFELWYALHFELIDSQLSRHQLGNFLSKHLKKKYQKSDKRLPLELSPYIDEAIKNANRLETYYNQETPCERNPFTTVHHLVQIIRYIK